VGTVSGLFRPREILCLYGSLNTMPRPTRNEVNINVHSRAFPELPVVPPDSVGSRTNAHCTKRISAEFSSTRRTGNHLNCSCTVRLPLSTLLCGTEHKVSHSPRDPHSNLPLWTRLGSFYLRWKMRRFTKFEGRLVSNLDKSYAVPYDTFDVPRSLYILYSVRSPSLS
jgi:hypothetical protein